MSMRLWLVMLLTCGYLSVSCSVYTMMTTAFGHDEAQEVVEEDGDEDSETASLYGFFYYSPVTGQIEPLTVDEVEQKFPEFGPHPRPHLGPVTIFGTPRPTDVDDDLSGDFDAIGMEARPTGTHSPVSTHSHASTSSSQDCPFCMCEDEPGDIRAGSTCCTYGAAIHMHCVIQWQLTQRAGGRSKCAGCKQPLHILNETVREFVEKMRSPSYHPEIPRGSLRWERSGMEGGRQLMTPTSQKMYHPPQHHHVPQAWQHPGPVVNPHHGHHVVHMPQHHPAPPVMVHRPRQCDLVGWLIKIGIGISISGIVGVIAYVFIESETRSVQEPVVITYKLPV